MFSRNSPLKRKHNEFRDPDYPQQEPQPGEDDGSPGCSANFANKRRKSGEWVQTAQESRSENYMYKVRQVIEREFQREIVMKQQQLEEIDDRLEKAKQLLNRLRYAIVSAYYKKQEIPLTAADAATLRSANSLFEREDKGPQMPLHPSVKKLIGKRPKDLCEVLRSCPKRTAAQNAVQTIRAKSEAQKREERKLKKIIKEQGIVIDHSKHTTVENDHNALLNAAAQIGIKTNPDPITTTSSRETSNKPSGKSLNASRLNNKIKHLIVVGNTSKYIGNELENDVKSQTQNITHKWLVYVQSKETKQPIERFIKKVRFYLHRSYRPNDVVDIEAPPFQVSRRGWGEFPMRVQLYFHPELHQKPVQLIHNIILDKTLSGIQTLGAETLLEIWLRDIKPTKSSSIEIKDVKPEIEIDKQEISSKPQPNIIARSEELVDDNLLDFLNKIEASPCSISADIEKIHPTVLVNEPLAVKIKTPSPEKPKVLATTLVKSPIKMGALEEIPNVPENPFTIHANPVGHSIVSLTPSTSVPVSSHFKIPLTTNSSITTKGISTFVTLPTPSAQVRLVNNATPVINNISQIPPLRPITPSPVHVTKSTQSSTVTIQKPPIIVNSHGKILMPSASVASVVHKTILPIVTSVTNISAPTSQISQVSMANKSKTVSAPSTTTIINAQKQILQKKLVQLVDSTGKVKYIQMFVAASSASPSVQNLNSSVAPKLITMAPSSLKNNTVTNTTQIIKTVTTPFLRSPNGAQLVPAMTTKPNIFKIVPENRQTKPQVFTFSTTSLGTTSTTTVATANTQQQFQLTTTTTAQAVGKIITPSGLTAAKPNNITLTVANKSLKSNCNNSMIPTKNLVFQKEGKVYLIDPQQMKYKQQQKQKKQVSLLKPQISLLKQQQQKLITPPATIGNSTVDKTTKSNTPTQLSSTSNISQVSLVLKQQRINSINALQLMQMKRMLFEKQFLRQEFSNMRSAVEYLLRRLNLIVAKESLVADFPFVTHTLQEFQSLTAFKQRAYEWLRAKNISTLLRNHKDLQRLNSSAKELFWSTKEIATFARQYAYTPPIKSLPKPDDLQQTADSSSKDFTDLVKSELKQEQTIHYDTLTDHCKVRKWIDKVWNTLNDYEQHEDEHQVIDIDSIEEDENKKNYKTQNISNTTSSHLHTSSLDTYLTTPPHLENQCQLVSDICKDLNIRLVPEELDAKVYHPAAQTVLAQCLHLFIEKLLRQSIALKQEKSNVSTSVIESTSTLMPQDFAKILASNSEFDFLTNTNFGSVALPESLESSIKQETL